MKQLSLSDFTGDWHGIVSYVEHSGEPVALYWDGAPIGIVLPPPDAARLLNRYDTEARARAEHEAAAPVVETPGLPTYLELLRDDPTLVPVVDGRRLEFMTMTNTSYVDPQQMYQFLDARSGTGVRLSCRGAARRSGGRLRTSSLFQPIHGHMWKVKS